MALDTGLGGVGGTRSAAVAAVSRRRRRRSHVDRGLEAVLQLCGPLHKLRRHATCQRH
jgi:hypothetical protein